MNIAIFIRDNLKAIPPSIGKVINYIPYSLRPGIGETYRTRKSEIVSLKKSNAKEKQKFVFCKVKKLVDFAFHNVRFYKEYYDDCGYHPDMLKSFSDIDKIPIITKALLNSCSLEQRSYPIDGRYIVNTGGSSGTPFGFYIEPSSMGHEWAHMHTIWEKLGYKSSDLKIVFGGRSDVKDLVEYDVVRNHFAIDIYASYQEVGARLKKYIQRYKIKYLHGYPSSIYDFAVYCEKFDRELIDLLRKNLKGAFLGSEYPHRHYRETIERVFGIPTISWYGHTERAVLAYEREEQFHYEPFLSYGFAESIANKSGEFELIGTSYYNYASPLIRYNTEDIIESPKMQDGILNSFQVLKGRSGEFVIDKDGKNVNLTGLIFGRHHELFNVSKFIQVRQIEKGKIEIYFVSDSTDEESASKLFDRTNLNFDLWFKKVGEPIRSAAGKVGLLIK